ncbi:HAD-IIIC family phosphatase [Saccharothrix sp. NRRL B-16314]|uniref:HAD-IIIC family phosphatase n=1 Tax=Saccharothrix sp. NRRL B-16314 TaxID=1463825 RepID=UPI000526F1A9|nr:HAD-IIIC family phosphatase [Saccharothrix sp. NRRL B-16314]
MSAPTVGAVVPEKPKQGRIKCIVWDLDNTLWDGVLLEDGDVVLRQDLVEHVKRLDKMGVLHSIASKNDHDAAVEKLRSFGLAEYFLFPQVNWNAKSESIRRIATALNLGLDAFAFVDDQEFERAEVAHGVPEVTCVDVLDVDEALVRPEFTPRFVTDESALRRGMYQGQIVRDELEKEFVGTNHEFLASLDLTFTIEPARREDLQRAEELTVRTNQLNSTGRTYSYEELDELRSSPDHLLLVASLTDRFGSYGKIGLALVEKGAEAWQLRMLLMSCRVMSRGVGMVMLNHVMGLARDAGAAVRADFVETGRNRMMQITYAFAGFREISRSGSLAVLEADLSTLQPPPPYVRVEVVA